jgi:hypothetical protein
MAALRAGAKGAVVVVQASADALTVKWWAADQMMRANRRVELREPDRRGLIHAAALRRVHVKGRMRVICEDGPTAVFHAESTPCSASTAMVLVSWTASQPSRPEDEHLSTLVMRARTRRISSDHAGAT